MNPAWTLRTARLTLTPVNGIDLPDLQAIKADPRVFAIMLGGVRTAQQAAEELAQPGVIISALAQRLEEKDTSYAALMRILADLAGAGGEAFVIAPADDPDDLAALDKAWAEEQVRFDAPAAPDAACPQAAAMVARFQNPEPVRNPAHG